MKEYKQIYSAKGKLSLEYAKHVQGMGLGVSALRLDISLAPLESFLLQLVKTKMQGKGSRSRFPSSPWKLHVALIGKRAMTKLNGEFRKKKYATDVLSFPLLDWSLPKGKFALEAMKCDFYLGDIVICKEKLFSQAKEFKMTISDEFLHLLVHGFLHLLGFDHEISSKQAEIMQYFEDQILDKISRAKRTRKKLLGRI